ncbi:MAG: InlB B-repeat-containing protein [Eubacterium sp.]
MKRESAWRKGASRLLVLLLSIAVMMSFSFVGMSFAADNGESTESGSNNPTTVEESIDTIITASIGSTYGKPLSYSFSYAKGAPSNGMSAEELLKSIGMNPKENILPEDEKDEKGNYLASSVGENGIYIGFPARLVFSDDQKEMAGKWSEDPEPRLGRETNGTKYYLYQNGNTKIHLWIYPIRVSKERIENVVTSWHYPLEPSKLYDGLYTWKGSYTDKGPDFITSRKPGLPELKEGRDYTIQYAFTGKYITNTTDKAAMDALDWHDTAEGMTGPGFVWEKITGKGNYNSYTGRVYMINSLVDVYSNQPVKYEGENDPSIITKSMAYRNNNPNSFGLSRFSVKWTRTEGEEPGVYNIKGKISINKPEDDKSFISWDNRESGDVVYSSMLGDTTNAYIWVYAHNGKFTIKKKSHIIYNSGTAQASEAVSDGKWKPGEKSESLKSAAQLNFTNDGYTFAGWNTQADGKGKTYQTGDKYTFTQADDEKDVTLYAQWQKTSAPVTPSTPVEEHTVTFHPGNDQPTFNQTVPDGGQAVRPDDPTRDGYRFDGWYTDSGLTQQYDFSTKVTSDLDLYAKWTRVTEPVRPVTPSRKVSGVLLPKVIAKGKHTQVFTWTALTNVDGYFIYTNHCDEGKKLHPFKKVADYKASKARVYTKRNLKTYHNYKYYVAAYQIRNGKKVIVKNSCTVHSVCGNTSARSTNVKATKAKKHAITLKKGQTYTLKASVYKISKNRAFLDATHCGLVRYLVRNDKIATVGYHNGKIKAKKAGKTTVYVLGVNGIRDKCVVTVK